MDAPVRCREYSARTLPDYESFFHHTTRRWIIDEEVRLKERYIQFNVQELMRAAANAAHRSRCAGIVKMAEGGFNKNFLLTMDDGSEIIARVPTSIAGSRKFSTASEVATLKFARKLPAPAVLAYSCNPNTQLEQNISSWNGFRAIAWLPVGFRCQPRRRKKS